MLFYSEFLSGKKIKMKVKIKEFRIKKGLTQEELAQRVGVRRETIVFLEQGKYNPSLKLAFKIAKELEISLEKIFIYS
jgi:putative transcriptional regulator